MTEHTCTEQTWFIARQDDNSLIHCGTADTGQHIATGLDHLELFNDVEQYIARKIELGVAEDA